MNRLLAWESFELVLAQIVYAAAQRELASHGGCVCSRCCTLIGYSHWLACYFPAF